MSIKVCTQTCILHIYAYIYMYLWSIYNRIWLQLVLHNKTKKKPSAFKGEIELSTTIILESLISLCCVNSVGNTYELELSCQKSHCCFRKAHIKPEFSTHISHKKATNLPTCIFSMHALNFFPRAQFTSHLVSTSGNGHGEAELEQNEGCT